VNTVLQHSVHVEEIGTVTCGTGTGTEQNINARYFARTKCTVPRYLLGCTFDKNTILIYILLLLHAVVRLKEVSNI
jgi:CobQ-like glutamine amidotransferase family enzyme